MYEEIQKYIDDFRKSRGYGQIIFCFENGVLIAIKRHQTFKPSLKCKEIQKKSLTNRKK